jgi:hypothetical protein
MSRTFRGWTATVAATIASTYALDTVATTAGGLLVLSGLLSWLGHGQALALLALSYVAWGAALGPALRANWALLERTGASSSLPSKVAHSFARQRNWTPAARRIITALGYVGTELAKEAPYYIGAIGMALFTPSVSATEAVLFLAGANCGAALYELVLARLVRHLLSRFPDTQAASFEVDWRPESYLAEYYSRVERDEARVLGYLVRVAGRLSPGQQVLVFGVGPTLHHLFPLVPIAGRIDICDLLPANLAAVERWLRSEPGAHDWQPFLRHTLACEGRPQTGAAVALRAQQTRACVGALLIADLRDPEPLPDRVGAYDLVVSAFCADSATGDLATWASYIQRIASLVRPGGTLVLACLRQSRGYRVGGRLFPSPNLDQGDLRRVLGPLTARLSIETFQVPEQQAHGYGGIMLAMGERSAQGDAGQSGFGAEGTRGAA